MQEEFIKINSELEKNRKALGLIIHILGELDTKLGEVNIRLTNLEGDKGMKGVNEELSKITIELQKIQKVYPYEDITQNLNAIIGQA